MYPLFFAFNFYIPQLKVTFEDIILKCMDTKDLIYSLYEIYAKNIPDCKPTFDRTDKLEHLMNKLFDKFEKDGVHRDSMGVSFLYDYFSYAYNCLTAFGEELKHIPLAWVIGMPQYKRWCNKPDSYHFLYQEGFLSHVKIPPLSELKNQFREGYKGVDISEERERQRFHSTAEGFINCILTTTLVDDGSKWCSTCSNREDCIEELKIRDKMTALRRGFIKL